MARYGASRFLPNGPPISRRSTARPISVTAHITFWTFDDVLRPQTFSMRFLPDGIAIARQDSPFFLGRLDRQIPTDVRPGKPTFDAVMVRRRHRLRRVQAAD